MKPLLYLLSIALVCVIAATSINCIQGPTTPPASSPTPSPEPALPANNFTAEQQMSIYNTAIANPYVKERILQTAWRSQHLENNRYAVNTSYKMSNVTYMLCHELAPGIDRTVVMPAAIIIPGDPAMAGINVVAFVNTTSNRVAYVGFVPREGAPVDNATFSSRQWGVDERDPVWGLHEYNNVTVVDTGYVKGMGLSQDDISRATALAMGNETVRKYIGTHRANMRDTTVQSFETGYPYRYVLAYPMVTIDVVDDGTHYDTIYALVDMVNNRVVRIEHGQSYIW